MSKPYLWVYESPGSFNPHDGGEPPYTDFSDVEKPGYTPLYADDLRDELLALLVEAANFIQPFNRAEEIIDRIDALISKATA